MTTKIPGEWCPNANERIPDDSRRAVRCFMCGRRLLIRPIRDTFVYEEIIGWLLPPHKTKSRILKRAKGDRSGARGRRG